MKRPIYDCFDSYYKTPFGAVERETPITFTLNLPLDCHFSECLLIMFRPGYKEKYINLQNQGEQAKDGEKFNVYSGVYTPQDTGLHHYYFTLINENARRYIKRFDASLGGFEAGELFQLTVYEKGMTTPEWLKGGIMYQIFPDRFAAYTDPENEAVIPTDRQLHTDWYEMPVWQPDNRGVVTNSDYFGGNLKGIREKLPYLQKLGVSCIYLNPIFEAHENHRYNTACYERIDPVMGTEQDFRELCAKAKEYGIGIILDGVFSHTGADSVYFNKNGRYGEHSGAYRDPESPYRDWYSFIKYPNVYESWWGFTSLPNVNENNPHYTEYICGDKGILQKWIDAGASGWRLDVADELPDEFIDNLRIAVKKMGEDKVIYGEVWEDASNKESYGVRRRYLTGKQLDSVMNYPFKECILNYIKYADPKPFIDGIMTIVEHYPKPCVDILMNFLSTHDTERAITRLAGKDIGSNDRSWQASNCLSDQQYVYGVALLKCAMVLQYFLPGVPCIYYGDEAGQEGYKDPFNRRTYPWGREDESIISYAEELGRIRKGCEAFAKGTVKFIEVTSETCIFRREDKEKGVAAVIYLNKSHKAKTFMLHDSIGSCQRYRVVRKELREHGRIHLSPYDYEVVYITL
ncbi:MAG: glycoside hydrolase family 13 protein [Firmicutes bacterium]|nr:glycoside hydrolase family 13 protein [[Eubacterium] siraeum]MCM1487769.1 glycoside hydrolase family 13 protein [Bacillota bacterium]